MKNVIQLILILILSSCATKKNVQEKEKSEFTFSELTKRFDSKKVEYIGVKKYCVGSIRLNSLGPNDCPKCFSKNDIYFFWTENGKFYVQKFDNCSEFNTVEIFDFKPTEFLKNNTAELQSESVKSYQVDKDTYSTVSHSCFRNYNLNDGQTKYEKKFDTYDLTGEKDNLNYESNNSLKLIELDNKLNKIISELEKENRFERNKKTCYNNV